MAKFKDTQKLAIGKEDQEIQELQVKIAASQDALNDVMIDLDSAESDKNLEVSHFQNEI